MRINALRLVVVFVPAMFVASLLAAWSRSPAEGAAPERVVGSSAARDDEAAREAFLAAYTVFMHARCMNCHPAGDAPLQGDDSRVHRQGVKRGPEGKGVSAMKCTNCHQRKNLAGEHMPPGSPVWHLPPPEMRMVFEGLSPGELCEQLKDPSRNGGKTLHGLLEHVSHDALVLWGWDPGDGRTPPPLEHAEFVAQVRSWIENGAACP